MDIEQLITLVFERKPLWDSREKTYHNRDVCRKQWNEIATEMESTTQILKTKWQSLRDNFRKEYLKTKKFKTGDGASDKFNSHWKYYQQLTFLTDAFASRKMESNVPPLENTITTAAAEDLEEDDIDEIEELVEESAVQSSTGNNATQATEKPTRTTNNSQTTRKRHTGRNQAISQLLAIEEKKLEHLHQVQEQKGSREDEDYYFLMSLLPHLRDLPKKRKLSVRLKLQQVLMDEENEESFRSARSSRSCSTVPTPSPSPSYSTEATLPPSHSFQYIDNYNMVHTQDEVTPTTHELGEYMQFRK